MRLCSREVGLDISNCFPCVLHGYFLDHVRFAPIKILASRLDTATIILYNCLLAWALLVEISSADSRKLRKIHLPKVPFWFDFICQGAAYPIPAFLL